MEVRADKRRLISLSGHRGADGAVEVGQVVRDEVGQIRVLGVAADLLDRVEVRGVGRQPLRLDPVRPAFLEDAHRRVLRRRRSSKASPATGSTWLSRSRVDASICLLSRSGALPDNPAARPFVRGHDRSGRSC